MKFGSIFCKLLYAYLLCAHGFKRQHKVDYVCSKVVGYKTMTTLFSLSLFKLQVNFTTTAAVC